MLETGLFVPSAADCRCGSTHHEGFPLPCRSLCISPVYSVGCLVQGLATRGGPYYQRRVARQPRLGWSSRFIHAGLSCLLQHRARSAVGLRSIVFLCHPGIVARYVCHHQSPQGFIESIASIVAGHFSAAPCLPRPSGLEWPSCLPALPCCLLPLGNRRGPTVALFVGNLSVSVDSLVITTLLIAPLTMPFS